MRAEAFEKMCIQIVDEVRKTSPIRTGNLRNNAIRFEWVSPNKFRIFVDETIAPYMPYTNEPWLSPRWRGAKNKNELWWDDKAVNALLTTVRRVLGDKIIKERSSTGAKW